MEDSLQLTSLKHLPDLEILQDSQIMHGMHRPWPMCNSVDYVVICINNVLYIYGMPTLPVHRCKFIVSQWTAIQPCMSAVYCSNNCGQTTFVQKFSRPFRRLPPCNNFVFHIHKHLGYPFHDVTHVRYWHFMIFKNTCVEAWCCIEVKKAVNACNLASVAWLLAVLGSSLSSNKSLWTSS